MHYLVISGDIIASHSLTDRRKKQKTFQTALKLASLKFEAQCISPLTNTSGDYFQMVLPNADVLFAIISHLEFSVPTLSFRYGLAVGSIDTEINNSAATGMDGIAFRRVREAHQRAKMYKHKFAFSCGSANGEPIDLLLQWMGAEQQRWSRQKKRAYALYKRGLKQKVIANRLHISQPAVSKMISSIGQKLVYHTEIQIQSLINRQMHVQNDKTE